MSAAARLDERERERLLGLIGIDRYVRRGAAGAAPVEAEMARNEPARRDGAARTAAAGTTPVAQPQAPTRPSLLDELGLDARAPRLLLLVETTRAPDPRVKPLLEAIRRSLPPHQMLDAADTPPRWPEFVLALGGRTAPPAGTHLVQCLPLHALRLDAGAKRQLWRDLKPLLRALRRS
jgi:hypothetical protein